MMNQLFTLMLAAAPAELLQEDIVVLHDENPAFARPPCQRCRFVPAGGALPPGGAGGIVVTGHSTWGSYVGLAAEELAATIAHFSRAPDFIVLDTCFGAQAELLLALHEAGVHPAVIVAATATVPARGFNYGDAFAGPRVDADALVRTLARGADPNLVVLRGVELPRLASTISQAHARAARCEGLDALVSVAPNLITAVADSGASVLVHVPASLVDACYPGAPQNEDFGTPVALVALLLAGVCLALRRLEVQS